MNDTDKYLIVNGYLCAYDDKCTCSSYEGIHEPHCGVEPIAPLDQVEKALSNLGSLLDLARVAKALTDYWQRSASEVDMAQVARSLNALADAVRDVDLSPEVFGQGVSQ